jgi:hypothetical protein
MTREEFNDHWRGGEYVGMGTDTSGATLEGWFTPEGLRSIANNIDAVNAALKRNTQETPSA